MSPAAKLSIDVLKKAIANHDWPAAKDLIDGAGGPALHTEAIAEAVRRAGDLVLPYPTKAQKKRDALIESLRAYVAAGAADGVLPEAVETALSTVRVAEAGYRELVATLAKTHASKLDAALHVSAALERSERELDHLQSLIDARIASGKPISLHGQLDDDDGTPVDVDSVLESCVSFVSMTLEMEAHKNKWIDADGVIVVPSLPEPSEEAIGQVGATMVLSVFWRRWRLTTERARVLGRSLKRLTGDELPAAAPASIKTVYIEEGDSSSDLLHRIALDRVTDSLAQNYFSLVVTDIASQIDKPILGGSDIRRLPPIEHISLDEILAIKGLANYLGYDPLQDMERHEGLRLVEWARGYCALMGLAREATKSQLLRTRSGWLDFFAGFGLVSSVAERLIDNLTFRRSSRDLFDHPFIKRSDGRFMLFGPSLRNLNVTVVLLSTLSNLSVQLRRKGPAFERVVAKTFEHAGINPYAFKFRNGADEYEYDAVVPWGDYLFVFECKNRSLPFNSPVQMHYFDLETNENIKQLHRLMKGLEDHPEKTAPHLPSDALTKTRVPVLLNCFPYAAPGKLDGVYLYDHSALSRFFSSGTVTGRAILRGETIAQMESSVRLWSGDKPTPEDLIAQLEMPVQFKAVYDATERDKRGFHLSPEAMVFGVSFLRRESGEVAKFAKQLTTASNVDQAALTPDAPAADS